MADFVMGHLAIIPRELDRFANEFARETRELQREVDRLESRLHALPPLGHRRPRARTVGQLLNGLPDLRTVERPSRLSDQPYGSGSGLGPLDRFTIWLSLGIVVLPVTAVGIVNALNAI